MLSTTWTKPFICRLCWALSEPNLLSVGYVEHYLNKTFYNLTTVALHDWKTYGEMKNMAQQKYALNLLESYLPSQTLEQVPSILVVLPYLCITVAFYASKLTFSGLFPCGMVFPTMSCLMTFCTLILEWNLHFSVNQILLYFILLS